MKVCKQIQLLLLTLVFILLPVQAFALVTIDVDIKPQFTPGETVSFHYTFISDKDEKIDYIASVNCPKAPIPLLEIKNVQLKKNVPFKEEYVYTVVTNDMEPQSCKAIVFIIEPFEMTEEQYFEILTPPGFEFNLFLCKDYSCTEKSKTFIKNEDIYLDYKSSVDNPVITVILILPNKEIKEVTLPTSITATQIGTYNLKITASKEGYKTISKEILFAVIEKEAYIPMTQICNANGVCDNNENYQNCPQDCPLLIPDSTPPTTKDDYAYNNIWTNKDAHIILTATDDLSRVKQTFYSISSSSGSIVSEGTSIDIVSEGEYVIKYWSVDKAGNTEEPHKITVKIDKTPPVIAVSVSPEANSAGWHNSDVTVTFTATDKLSGVKSVTQPVTVAAEGANQTVIGEALDIADNKSTASVTLNIDKTPPKLSITATPDTIWPPDNKMVDVTIKGEATDNLSGIDTLTFKVTDEYGKVQPSISGFGSIIKLEASRDGNDKDGRTYTISATAKDKAGNESTTSAIVIVPHDQRKK